MFPTSRLRLLDGTWQRECANPCRDRGHARSYLGLYRKTRRRKPLEVAGECMEGAAFEVWLPPQWLWHRTASCGRCELASGSPGTSSVPLLSWIGNPCSSVVESENIRCNSCQQLCFLPASPLALGWE